MPGYNLLVAAGSPDNTVLTYTKGGFLSTLPYYYRVVPVVGGTAQSDRASVKHLLHLEVTVSGRCVGTNGTAFGWISKCSDSYTGTKPWPTGYPNSTGAHQLTLSVQRGHATRTATYYKKCGHQDGTTRIETGTLSWSQYAVSTTLPAGCAASEVPSQIRVVFPDTLVVWSVLPWVDGGPSHGTWPGMLTGGGNPALDEQVCAVADPVSCATGELFESVTDLALPGRSSFVLTRTYSSQRDSWTGGELFGSTWFSPLDMGIVWDGDLTTAMMRQENGSTVQFRDPDGDGNYSLASRGRASLATVRGQGGAPVGYTFTRGTDEMTVAMDADGRLSHVSGRNGDGYSVTWPAPSTGDPLLVSLDDGRVVTLEVSAAGRILQATGPGGRTVAYDYTDGELSTVTDVHGKDWGYLYGTEATLVSLLDPLGNTVQNEYDGDGRVVRQVDDLGNETLFSYTAGVDSLVTTTTDPTGHKTRFRYDHGLLTEKVVAPNSTAPSAWAYGYDGAGNLVRADDPTGRTATSRYDVAGNLVETIDAAGAATTFTYTGADQVETVTDPQGSLSTFGYDTGGNLTSLTTPTGPVGSSGTATWGWGRDPAHRGDILSATDPAGKTTTFEYNDKGMPVSTLDPTGRETSVTRNDYGQPLTGTAPGGAVTDYGYLPGGDLLTVTDAAGGVVTYGYDAAGRPGTVTDTAGETWSREFDAVGRLVTRTGPAGVLDTYGYDGAGRLVSTTDADGVAVEVSYDNHGRVNTQTAPAGAVTTFSYDRADRVVGTSTVDPAGGPALTTSASYDVAGRAATLTGTDGVLTTLSYDELGRVVTSSRTGAGTTTTGFDRAGNVTSVAAPDGSQTTHSYDARGLLTATVAPDGARTTLTYDDAARPLTTVSPRGNAPGADPVDYTTTNTYDPAGQLDTVTDPLGRVTTYDYDQLGRLVARTDPKGRSEERGWDPRGLLTSVTGTDGATTTFAHDDTGQLVSMVSPAGLLPGAVAADHTTAYGYTPAGRLASSTDPLGRTATTTWEDGVLAAVGSALGSTTYGHNGFGRTTGMDYSDATPDVALGYDPAGRLSSVTDAAGTKTYGYAPGTGQLTGISRGTEAWSYGHDPYGRLESRTRPDGTTETVTRDSSGRATGVSYGAAAQSMVFGYDPDGRVASASSAAAGFRETYGYDRAGQVAAVTTETKDAAGTWETATRHDIDRDATGNPATVTVTRGASIEVRSYRYDDADRLTAVCYGTATCTVAAADESWTYDQDGNRASATRGATTTTYTRDRSGRVLAADNGSTVRTWAYDADGNVLSDGVNSWTYWLNGAPKSHTRGTTTTDYVVDGAGRRLTATSGGQSTTYAWDETINAAAPASATTPAGTTRLFAGPTGTTYQQTGPAGDQFLGHDPLGSIIDTYTANGGPPTRAGSADYDPFGADRDPIGAPPTPGVGDLGFGGSLRLGDGLYHLQARDYNTTTGQLTALDPLGDGYAYVGNRPTVFVDPQGLCSVNPFSDDACTAHLAAAIPGGRNLDNALTFTVGGIDELTMGVSRRVRHGAGLGGAVNECSDSYRAGSYTGIALSMFVPGPKTGLLRLSRGAGHLDDLGTHADDVTDAARAGATTPSRDLVRAAGSPLVPSSSRLRAQIFSDAGTVEPMARTRWRASSKRPDEIAAEGGGPALTRVGRWMSPAEHDAMSATRTVQEGAGGVTNVAHPADVGSYMRQAPPGTRYVEFDVPQNSLVQGGKEGWATIPGPNSIFSRLNVQRGLAPYQFPGSSNIEWVASKLPPW